MVQHNEFYESQIRVFPLQIQVIEFFVPINSKKNSVELLSANFTFDFSLN